MKHDSDKYNADKYRRLRWKEAKVFLYLSVRQRLLCQIEEPNWRDNCDNGVGETCPEQKRGNMALNCCGIPSCETGYERDLISHILSNTLKIIATFTYCITSSFMKFSFAQMCRLVLTTVAIINIGHSEERGKWQTSSYWFSSDPF